MINNKGEEVGIIYGWYCIPTGNWYIGQTVNPEERFKTHIRLAINKKDNNRFHNALRKYGLENWVYCVLEENVLIDNLNQREIWWIEFYDSFYNGYNMTVGGQGCIKMSEESKKKISEALKGKTSLMKGKKHTEESKRKMSESHKGHSGYWTNKHLSEEHRRNLSESLKGHIAWNKGIPMTKETKKKISESCKGKISPRKGMRYTFTEEEKNKKYESRRGKPSPNRKQVSKYDINGNFIKKYDCIKDAIKENPKSGHLIDVCKGLRKQAGGFIWKYAS